MKSLLTLLATMSFFMTSASFANCEEGEGMARVSLIDYAVDVLGAYNEKSCITLLREGPINEGKLESYQILLTCKPGSFGGVFWVTLEEFEDTQCFLKSIDQVLPQ